MRLLFLLFLIVPIVEMVVLLKVGSFIGAFYTILLVLLTAVIGVSLLKRQGLSTFVRANQKMQTGQMPVAEMGEGLMLAVAGALLLTPGFVTDAIGFLLLTPGVRGVIGRKWLHLMMTSSMSGTQSGAFYSSTEYHSSYNPANTRRSQFDKADSASKSDVIEGEFREIDQDEKK